MTTTRVFQMPRIESVLEGPAALSELAGELQSRGLQRALLVTGRTLSASAPFAALVEQLGEHLAGVYAKVEAHNPVANLAELIAFARDTGADVLVGIGGGSAIDAAKLAALGVAEGVTDPRDLLKYTISNGLPALQAAPLPVVAVPTTLSAAEWNGVAALVDDTTQTKELARYLELTPTVILLDPELAALTPRNLWVTTGARAIDHSVELAYATNAHPYVTALCTAALGMLAENLPKTAQNPHDLEATLKCQQAAWLSLVGVHNVPVGLSHAIGHQLGAAGVPHGVTSCIVLPHVMRFFEPHTRDQQQVMARVLAAARGEAEPLSAADEVSRLFDSLGVPRRISDFDLTEEVLEKVVNATMTEAEAVIKQAPRDVSRQDVRELLQAAF